MNDQIAKLMNEAFAQGGMPNEAQRKLDDLYASLGDIPQSAALASPPKASAPVTNAQNALGNVCESDASDSRMHSRGLRQRTVAVLAAAVAATLAIGGAAYGGARLLGVGPSEAPFFQGANLPVYDSMKQGAASMSAEVGQMVQADGVQVTLDSVSCDRNVANVYLTLEREGGFDLDALSQYEGSQENEWSRLQRLVPLFRFTALCDGETLCEGDVRVLDAYTDESGAVKCLLHLVPESTLPDQVEIQLHAESPWTTEGSLRTGEEDQPAAIAFSVGLDLSNVEAPRGFERQTLEFQTNNGVKKLPVERFSVSELGCVLVTSGNSISAESADDGGTALSQSERMDLNLLKISDGEGNVLQQTDAGDGHSMPTERNTIVEYGGIDQNASCVTFTPYTQVGAESFASESVQIDAAHIGAQLATSEYGGYELTGYDVSDGTVSIALKPYGMTFGFVPELYTEDLPTTLETQSVGPEGETYTGRHVGILWWKWDYATGDVLQMTSYYAATDDELRAMAAYRYISLFGTFQEEGDAALTCNLL